jgi:hypothetical protein
MASVGDISCVCLCAAHQHPESGVSGLLNSPGTQSRLSRLHIDADSLVLHPNNPNSMGHDAITPKISSPILVAISPQSPQSKQSISQQPAVPPPSRGEEPRCWEHGCRGRKFTNRSNLNRHCREKAARRWGCDDCGAKFTRRSAQIIHIVQRRCQPSKT